MKALVNLLMPNNCRAEFQQAAEKNSITHLNVMCLLREHRDKVIHEISTPKAEQKEMFKPFATR